MDVRIWRAARGQQLMNMINQLNGCGPTIESGSVPRKPSGVSPEEMLVAAVLRLRPAAEAAAIAVQAEGAVELPELYVDTQLLGRVFDNLCDNAGSFAMARPSAFFFFFLWGAGGAAATGGRCAVGISDEGPASGRGARRLF